MARLAAAAGVINQGSPKSNARLKISRNSLINWRIKETWSNCLLKRLVRSHRYPPAQNIILLYYKSSLTQIHLNTFSLFYFTFLLNRTIIISAYFRRFICHFYQNGAAFLSYLGAWGGFYVVGAPVFTILLECSSTLSPYKQLDTQVAFSSKKLLSMPLSYSVFGLHISQVLQLDNFAPRHRTTISFQQCCLPLPAFLCARHEAWLWLEWVLLSVGGSAIAATAPVIHAKEKRSPKPSPVIFSSMS